MHLIELTFIIFMISIGIFAGVTTVMYGYAFEAILLCWSTYLQPS